MDKLSKAGANSRLACANGQVRLGTREDWALWMDAGDEAQRSHSQEGPCNNGPFLVSVSVPCVSRSRVSEVKQIGNIFALPTAVQKPALTQRSKLGSWLLRASVPSFQLCLEPVAEPCSGRGRGQAGSGSAQLPAPGAEPSSCPRERGARLSLPELL